jgi:hypothetical protein
MKLHQIALGFVLLSASASAGEQAPMDLARRYVVASGGMTGAILAMHIRILQSDSCKQDSTCRATNTGHFKAVREAMDQDHAAIESADEKLAGIVSRTFDTSELDAYLAFWERPDGRSIQGKRAIQGIRFDKQEGIPTGLTKSEHDALGAYLDTPAAKAITAKEMDLYRDTMLMDMKLQMQIGRDAGAIYCRHTGYCKPWVWESNRSQ